jgi:hypothetical protein
MNDTFHERDSIAAVTVIKNAEIVLPPKATKILKRGLDPEDSSYNPE